LKSPAPEGLAYYNMASHPSKIGKYNVEGILGRGGMGIVYKAVDSQIGRYVAIKMILSGGDQSLLERFQSEARSTGSLQCPNIVTVYDFGEQDGNPYLVMQYLEGSSLESMIQKNVSLTLSDKLGIIIDVCNGLAYAHQRGVIHRDIKPANIMVLQDGVNDGMAVIVDFGIARIGGDTRITRTDQIIGSVHYMSAEQLQAKEPDNRTDVYATGVVLFQLLTGALPFDSQDTAATLLKIVNEEAPSLSAYIKEYPVELEEIVRHALAKDREERYASAKDLAFDLTQVQDRLKSETVAQLLGRAEISLQREDFTRAREHLQQAQRVDRQNTKVQKMLSAVEDRLRHLQRIEQARALRGQADEAYLEHRYDDALRLLEQAVALDGNNADLQVFRESVRSAQERAVSLRRALRRAEGALQDGDIDEAQNALSEAFKIDPQDTQANALKVVIAQQAEEKLRHAKAKKLLDEARGKITSRNLTAAFDILRNVETLDPDSIELQSVLKLAMMAQEQEKRRVEIEALRRQIEAALTKEDFATAVAKANEGILRFPQEQSFVKSKALAEAQRQRVEKKAFIKEQFSAANSLADSGQLRQALALLDRAQQHAPGSSELESLRAALLDRLTTEEAEERKRRAVETTLLEEEQIQRKNQAREEEEARRQREQFQSRLRGAISEGERILTEHGASEAAKYIASQSAQYRETADFNTLAERVSKHLDWESLKEVLARNSDPNAQVSLAEDALRKNPANEAVRDSLAFVRSRKERIDALAERARTLEASRQYAEAAAELQLLQQLYPEYPHVKSEIRRLGQLDEQRKALESKPVQPRDQVERKMGELRATTTISKEDLETQPSEVSDSSKPQKPLHPDVYKPAPTPDSASVVPAPSIWSRPWVWAVLAAAMLLGAALAYRKIVPSDVAVSIQAVPSDSIVTVDRRPCHAPCELRLAPGYHEVEASREGYSSQKQRIRVTRDGTGSFAVNLPPIETPVIIASAKTVEPAETNSQALKGELPIRGVGEKAPSALFVKGPFGAKVVVDNHFSGDVPSGGELKVPIDVGTHHVEVTEKGFDIWATDVRVNAGASSTVTAKMKAAYVAPLKTEPVAEITPVPPTRNAPAPTDTFSISPETMQPGQAAELKWDTENATEVQINGEKVESRGSKKVFPTESKDYELIAKGLGGSTRDRVHVSISTPPLPPNTPTVGLVPLEDQKQIAGLLSQYADTFARRDARAVPALWPGVPPPYLKVLKDSYKLNPRVSFSDIHYYGEPGGLVRVVATQSVQDDHAPRTFSATIFVTHQPGHWVIQYIPPNSSK
jgi:serine/threonine protein kinase